jgi:hypothetical protein
LAVLPERATFVQGEGLLPVVYLKDAAYNARKGRNKRDAVTRIAETLHVLARSIDAVKPILIISDHNSEPGIDAAYAGATVWGLAVRRSATDFEGYPLEVSTCWAQEELVRWLRLIS